MTVQEKCEEILKTTPKIELLEMGDINGTETDNPWVDAYLKYKEEQDWGGIMVLLSPKDDGCVTVDFFILVFSENENKWNRILEKYLEKTDYFEGIFDACNIILSKTITYSMENIVEVINTFKEEYEHGRIREYLLTQRKIPLDML